MRNTPTDLELLNHIYDTYYQDFLNFLPEKKRRTSRILVPLDLQKIATHFKMDLSILFGRFYYDLNHRYSYKDNGGVMVKLFLNEVHGQVYDVQKGKEVNAKEVDCVQFL